MRRILLVGMICCFWPMIVLGDDLYRVEVNSHEEAGLLNASGIKPLVAVTGGYLVLVSERAADDLRGRGIVMELMARDVDRGSLAIDIRRDELNSARFDLIYKDQGLRLFRVAPDKLAEVDLFSGLMAVEEIPTGFAFQAPVDPGERAYDMPPDLSDLISLISQVNLGSYVEQLQAFGVRRVETPPNTAASDWIFEKFVDFGYDSVAFDSFYVYNQWTHDTVYGRNVVAYKPGVDFPEKQIVLGAHFDAVPGSPGADDNASGVAAVLEMARLLQSMETGLSFVFVLFDAEEVGLYGAHHYAAEALTRGDEIVYMFNLDMIGHYENTNQANLFHGNYLEYTKLCRQLADSLLGMNAVMAGGSGGSDHYPFQIRGFEATFLAEYIFSTVYHSPSDSTTNMSFTYMTDMVRMALATVFTVDYINIPKPALALVSSDGWPRGFEAAGPAYVTLAVSGINGGVLTPSSVRFYYSVNGEEYSGIPMSDVGGGLFRAEFPVVVCGRKVLWYVTAEESQGKLFSSGGADDPHVSYGLRLEQAVFADDFNADQGWTVSGSATAGYWERGVPAGGGGTGDPLSDFDGSGYGYFTGNTAGIDIDGGNARLESPLIPLIDNNYHEVRFGLWLNNGAPNEDFVRYFVNNGTGPFFTVDTVGPYENSAGGWNSYSFWVDHYLNGAEVMRLRLEAADGGYASTVEAACDAVKVLSYSADPLALAPAELPDWTTGQFYSVSLPASGGVGDYEWVDQYGGLDGSGLLLDYYSGIVSGTPIRSGPVSFTAWIVDEMGNYTEQSYGFSINEAVSLETVELPDGEVGAAYEFDLEASGGTGTLIWSDPNGDLTGTGLSLSPTGTISGTVADSMTIGFTARVADITESMAERFFQFSMKWVYLPGDANDDTGVDVGDAVYIVNYAFKGGAAPDPLIAGDANRDGGVNVGDAVFLINYVFKGGPPPQK